MRYEQYAQKAFEVLCQNAPANDCSVLIHENGVLADAGFETLGGWSSAKLVLEGLICSRGQVNYTHRHLENGMQVPALELFLDSPIEAAGSFRQNECGVCGVANAHSYALGLLFASAIEAKKEQGNLVIASENSLLAAVYAAALPMMQAIYSLQAAQIEDIPWGWCSCPVAPMLKNKQQREMQEESLRKTEACINLWVRGSETALQNVCDEFVLAPLYLHELESARCYRNILACESK